MNCRSDAASIMWPFSDTPQLAAIKAEFELAKERMVQDELIATRDHSRHIRGVRPVAENDKGQLALIVASGHRARAVHQILNDGTFSKSGPKWTKLRWTHKSRRFAIIEAVFDLTPGGVGTVNSQVRTYGIRILKMDTDSLPVMSFEEWRWFFHPSV